MSVSGGSSAPFEQPPSVCPPPPSTLVLDTSHRPAWLQRCPVGQFSSELHGAPLITGKQPVSRPQTTKAPSRFEGIIALRTRRVGTQRDPIRSRNGDRGIAPLGLAGSVCGRAISDLTFPDFEEARESSLARWMSGDVADAQPHQPSHCCKRTDATGSRTDERPHENGL